MLQDKFMFASDELIAEVEARKDAEFAKKDAEKNKQLAKVMILNDEPLEKIEQYTGLNIAAIKPIAQSLGRNCCLVKNS